jgi:hypothetical protein
MKSVDQASGSCVPRAGGGLWWTKDGGGQGVPWSVGLLAVPQNSPQLHQIEEEVVAVLTVGFGGRHDGGVRLAVKRSKRRRWISSLGGLGNGEVELDQAKCFGGNGRGPGLLL